MLPFLRLSKLDDFQGIAEGIIAAQEPDADGEILDYTNSKPFFQKWSANQFQTSGGKSYGNIRLQHDPKKVVGLLTAPLAFDDTNKRVKAVARIIDPIAKEMLRVGALTGFSIGGDYISKTPLRNGLISYVANPIEVSVCDRPCSPSATYDLVHADGQIELRKFVKVFGEDELLQKALMFLKSGFSDQDVAHHLSLTPGQIWKAKSRDAGVRLNMAHQRERRRNMVENNPFVR